MAGRGLPGSLITERCLRLIDGVVSASTSPLSSSKRIPSNPSTTPAEPGPSKLVVHPEVLRERLGMGQAEFALALGVPLETLSDWEAEPIVPDAGARSLLAAAWRDPQTVSRLVAGRDGA